MPETACACEQSRANGQRILRQPSNTADIHRLRGLLRGKMAEHAFLRQLIVNILQPTLSIAKI
eukprot:m.834 g.834  ORF g.834 m.834 type:complete len:63 (+) comp312_c0_seq1:2-190(+)